MICNYLNIFCIGDPHIRIEEEDDIYTYFQELFNIIQSTDLSHTIDFIIILGDVLHNHSTLQTGSLNLATQFFKFCKSIAKTFCLVGNHDFINNDQFLNSNHWMNSFKDWDNNFIIVDKVETFVKNNIQISLSPYVPNGRFVEALNTSNNEELKLNWKNSSIIFAHQLLNGAKMGAIIENNVEEWLDDYPLCISGHIHSFQKVKNNYYCLGSSRYVGYGDNGKKYCSLIRINEEDKTIYFKKLQLNIKSKQVFTIMITNSNFNTLNEYLEKIGKKSDTKYVKLIFKGEKNLIQTFKQSSMYKSCLELYHKINFKFTVPTLVTNNNNNIVVNNSVVNNKDIKFISVLQKEINGNEELETIFKLLL